jgi:hypothetical protein
VCRIFLPSFTLCNTATLFTRSVQLIFSILLQHHISKLSRYFRSNFRRVQLSSQWRKSCVCACSDSVRVCVGVSVLSITMWQVPGSCKLHWHSIVTARGFVHIRHTRIVLFSVTSQAGVAFWTWNQVVPCWSPDRGIGIFLWLFPIALWGPMLCLIHRNNYAVNE